MTFLLLILSVAVGVALVLFIKPEKKTVQLLLAFSGAYLLSVTVLHLFPEVYHNAHNTKFLGIIILLGVLMQSVLESFSKGAEHGHFHTHENEHNGRFPWVLFISLCIHAFSEGLPIHHNHNNLLWAIIVHKVPIAIVLTSFLLNTKYSKKQIFVFLFVFSLMSPLGHLISEKASWIINYYRELNAFIIGAFLHISTIILFEANENHKFNLKKFATIVSGILLAIFTM